MLEDETLQYFIKQSYGKVLFQNKQNVLFFEAVSTDDLDHVEGDSLQNKFPEIILSIEDFPIDCETLEGLLDRELNIPLSVGEAINADGETFEVFYTNLNLNDEEDLATNDNILTFKNDEEGNLYLNWKGTCDHFDQEEESIQFEVQCPMNFKEEKELYLED